jgi:hypothetical protein
MNTKVVREVAMTALARIQHFCISVERTTEFSVSVSLLPGQLGSFPQIAFFRRAEWKFSAKSNANFEAYEILHLLTKFGQYFGDWAVGCEIFYDCVAAIFE